jgi:Predicted membrane protein
LSAWWINPLISVVPRIFVGLVAGLVFMALRKKIALVPSAALAALAGSLTNTVLVLTALNLFSDMVKWDFFEQFKQFFVAIISINGGIELVAAIIIAPVLATAVLGQMDKAKG